MSKKVPVYLSEEDLRLLLMWGEVSTMDWMGDDGTEKKLRTRLEEELDTFKTKLEQVLK